MKKTLIIIQARMGSKRLPGKMMLKLDNYSILEWVIKRIKKVKNKTDILIATTKEKKRITKFVKLQKKIR